jgi:hypothetical protein
MPELCRFYGIVIKMFFRKREHNPPHFHAIYGEYVGEYDIRTLEMLEGDLPNQANKLVLTWAKEHQDELLEIWNSQNFVKLEPLE